MYRKLRSFFESTNTLKHFDYFLKQKENLLTCCVDTLEKVIQSIQSIINANDITKDKLFISLLKVSPYSQFKFSNLIFTFQSIVDHKTISAYLKL